MDTDYAGWFEYLDFCPVVIDLDYLYKFDKSETIAKSGDCRINKSTVIKHLTENEIEKYGFVSGD